MFSALLGTGERVEQAIPHGRFVYVHIARGTVSLNGTILAAGDAATITDESRLVLEQGEKAEVLVFELR